MYYDKNYSWISNLFHQIKLAILCELLEVPFQTKGKPEYKRGVLHMITLAFHIGKRRMDYSVRWSLGHSSKKEKLNDKEDFWFPVWPIRGLEVTSLGLTS